MWRPGAARKTVAGRFGTLGRPDASTRRRGRPTEAAEATPQPQRGDWAQNRHGGAPRGVVPVARDGPRFANVVSRCYGRDGTKDTASRRSAAVSAKPMNYQLNSDRIAAIPEFFPVRRTGPSGHCRAVAVAVYSRRCSDPTRPSVGRCARDRRQFGLPRHYDWIFAAYDAKTLNEVWSFNVGSPIQAPPMSYSVNGKQYIAILVGARMWP